jgi:3-oxoadipate enol-lactonase
LPRPSDAAPALPSPWPGDRGGHLWARDREVVLPDGTRVRYTVRGPDGAPWVVCAPGFLCPDSHWRDIAPALVEDHRVVLLSHRGTGASTEAGGGTLPPSADAYTIPRLAEDVIAVMDAEDASSATLLGHSMGVQVVLEVWRVRPDLVRALVLAAGTHASPFRTMYDSPAASYLFPLVSMLGAATPRALSRRVMRAIELPLARPIGYALRALGDDTPWPGMTTYRAHLSRIDPRTAIWTARAMHHYDAGPWLRDVTVPTSVIVGTHDGWCPSSVGEAQAAAIPDARLEIVPSASHTLPLEHPEVVVRHVRQVEQRAEGRPTGRRIHPPGSGQ